LSGTYLRLRPRSTRKTQTTFTHTRAPLYDEVTQRLFSSSSPSHVRRFRGGHCRLALLKERIKIQGLWGGGARVCHSEQALAPDSHLPPFPPCELFLAAAALVCAFSQRRCLQNWRAKLERFSYAHAHATTSDVGKWRSVSKSGPLQACVAEKGDRKSQEGAGWLAGSCGWLACERTCVGNWVRGDELVWRARLVPAVRRWGDWSGSCVFSEYQWKALLHLDCALSTCSMSP